MWYAQRKDALERNGASCYLDTWLLLGFFFCSGGGGGGAEKPWHCQICGGVFYYQGTKYFLSNLFTLLLFSSFRQTGSIMGREDGDYADGYRYKAWSHVNGG